MVSLRKNVQVSYFVFDKIKLRFSTLTFQLCERRETTELQIKYALQNLKFAIKVQEKANELYPGLFKPIILRGTTYNQHVTKAATIIEVGATGNTLDQTLVSMKYLAKVLSEVVK